jgi:hypothetical protein
LNITHRGNAFGVDNVFRLRQQRQRDDIGLAHQRIGIGGNRRETAH